jgi:hypothetical protein
MHAADLMNARRLTTGIALVGWRLKRFICRVNMRQLRKFMRNELDV